MLKTIAPSAPSRHGPITSHGANGPLAGPGNRLPPAAAGLRMAQPERRGRRGGPARPRGAVTVTRLPGRPRRWPGQHGCHDPGPPASLSHESRPPPGWSLS